MFHDYPENRDSTIGHLRRGTIDKVDDTGSQQIIKKLRGLKSEAPEDVYRPQQHGISSNPPPGSEGLILSLGGRGDRMVALGYEHKDHRPKNTPVGGTVIYDANGNSASIVKDNVRIVHSSKIQLVVGGTSIEITPSGIVLNGNVDLGGTGGLPVDRTDDNPSTKVKAV